MSVDEQKKGISRRRFIQGIGGSAIGTAALGSAQQGYAAGEKPVVVGPDVVKIKLTVNGKKRTLKVEPRATLLDVLRDRLTHTGTKRVCNKGQCGACTVILNGRTVLACSMFAIDADGSSVQTIEGLAKGDQLHPVQEAFVKHDAFQCGFCTSGMIMSCVAMLEANPSPTIDEIKSGVAGNLCRCGSYPNIFKAVAKMKKGG